MFNRNRVCVKWTDRATLPLCITELDSALFQGWICSFSTLALLKAQAHYLRIAKHLRGVKLIPEYVILLDL